jgi:hypothetical protein
VGVALTSLAERWVALYTRGLPDAVREARCDEIASDVFEQRASNGASERALRASIGGRTVRGIPGDVVWRFEEGRAMKHERRVASTRPTGLQAAWATVTQSWFTPVAVLVGVFDVLAAVYVIADEDGKMPGQAIGPVVLCLFAVAMFTGLWLRWRSQFDPEAAPRSRDRRTRRDAIWMRALVLVAVVFFAVGMIGLTVGLVGGVLALAAVVVIGARRSRPEAVVTPAPPSAPRTQSIVLPDVLIVVATLPALALFWMVFPTILAIVVIGGVIGTGAGARRAAASA